MTNTVFELRVFSKFSIITEILDRIYATVVLRQLSRLFYTLLNSEFCIISDFQRELFTLKFMPNSAMKGEIQ